MWIVRSKYGDLWLCKEKPFKKDGDWRSSDEDYQVLINSGWFPEVSWEDEEPRELILKPIKRE